MRLSRSFISIGRDILVRISTHFVAALWNASEMADGWIPLYNNFSAASSKDPAITTTDVVPSPASISCDLDSSTS